MFLTVAINTTWCPDTPSNWANFYRLKAELLAGGLRRGSGTVGERLRLQQARENKQLRSYSTYLPGYEPDR